MKSITTSENGQLLWDGRSNSISNSFSHAFVKRAIYKETNVYIGAVRNLISAPNIHNPKKHTIKGLNEGILLLHECDQWKQTRRSKTLLICSNHPHAKPSRDGMLPGTLRQAGAK